MNIKERWNALSKEDKRTINELHKLASIQVEYIDELAKLRQEAKTFDVYDLCLVILNRANSELERIELELQRAWGFDLDPNKHTWWLQCKQCTCPKMDNKDPLYFGNGKIITEDCPVHGTRDEEFKKKRELAVHRVMDGNMHCFLKLRSGDIEKEVKGWLTDKVPNNNLFRLGLYKYAIRKDHKGNVATLEPTAEERKFGDFITKELIVFPALDKFYRIESFRISSKSE